MQAAKDTDPRTADARGNVGAWARAVLTAAAAVGRALYTVRIFAVVLVGATVAAASPADAASLIEQRQWYERAKVALDTKDMATYRRLRRKLSGYPLHPYLDYRHFLQMIDERTPREFNSFIAKYQTLPFTGTLRSRYLFRLADDDDWKGILTVQDSAPRDRGLQCVYYRAHYEAGEREKAWAGARQLWLTGRSVSDWCDPLFDAWAAAGGRSDDDVVERMLLAFASRNRGLLRYLRDELLPDDLRAKWLVALYDEPENVRAFATNADVTPFSRELTRLAVRRWARQDISSAVAAFERVVAAQDFEASARQRLGDALAARLLPTDDEGLVPWRDRMLKTSRNVRLLETRIRLAMRAAAWSEVRTWISRLPAPTQQTNRWVFWRGWLARRAGNRAAAKKIWTPILGRSDYYSAAAATLLKRPIRYPVEPTPEGRLSVAKYAQTLARVKELIALKKIVDAKREWRDLLARAAQEDKVALAVYASKNDWYHLTVKATISGALWHHMDLRFPFAYRWWFETFSKSRKVPLSTMYALARLESALDTHAASPARAYGLLQLLPSTAREVARQIRFRYRGRRTLFDPGVNVRLGSAYLRRMLAGRNGDRVLAFASYNAGYGRVSRWKKETRGKLDVFAFIEQIPFNETRGYVQSGLMFDVFYSRRLGRRRPLLDRHELRARY